MSTVTPSNGNSQRSNKTVNPKAAELRRLKDAQHKRSPMQHPPRLLVLVGIPGMPLAPAKTRQARKRLARIRLLTRKCAPCAGSGKSTFASELNQLGFQVICQDELGNRIACERATVGALLAEKNVVIDRCNFDAKQRKHWVGKQGRFCGARESVRSRVERVGMSY